MKTYVSIIFFTFFSGVANFSFSQISKADILWSAETKLAWTDFRGSPSPTVDQTAQSSIKFGFYVKPVRGEKGKFMVSFYTLFERYKSWYKRNVKNDYVLQHEQIHFDIAEVFARKARREIMNSKKVNKATVNKIMKGILLEYARYTDLFDAETSYGYKHEAQAQWAERIKKELDELEEYKEHTFLAPKWVKEASTRKSLLFLILTKKNWLCLKMGELP